MRRLLLLKYPAGSTRSDLLPSLVIKATFQRGPFQTAPRHVVILNIFARDIFENTTRVTRDYSHVFSPAHVLLDRTHPRGKRLEKGVRKPFDSSPACVSRLSAVFGKFDLVP